MTYNYKCNNISCIKRNEVIEIKKPMSEASCSEYCKECHEKLQRVYNPPGIKPAGDKYKS